MDEIEFLSTLSTLIWNGISKQDAVEMIKERVETLTQY